MQSNMEVKSNLPNFSNIQPEKMVDNLKVILEQNLEKLEAALDKKPYSWKSLMLPLEDAQERFYSYWAPIHHLHNAMDSEALRVAYTACLPLIDSYNLAIKQNKDFYNALQTVRSSYEYVGLSPTQQKVLGKEIQDCERNGVNLSPEQKERFLLLRQNLTKLNSKFSENLKDERARWRFDTTNQDDLRGLSKILLDQAAEKAKKEGKSGWTFSLDDAVAILENVDNRATREIIVRAFYTVASDQPPYDGKFDNSKVIEEILQVRKEMAVDLLGYKSYSEYTLETTMAKTYDNTLAFVNDLIVKSKPFADQDLKDIAQELKLEGVDHPELCDKFYYSEKLKRRLHGINQEDTRPYFPLNKVLDGWFGILHKLFGVTLRKQEGADTWHKDVSLYNVYDENNNLRGSVYLDLYQRPHKGDGGWNYLLRHRRSTQPLHQQAVSILGCNFNPPKEGEKTTYLTQADVQLLFHEFGHCMQVMLGKVDCASLSDFGSMPWDAVEIPSTFFENFAKQPEVLRMISQHKETGEPFPAKMIEKIVAAKNFHSALDILFYLEHTLFDLRIHAEYDPTNKSQVQDLMMATHQFSIPPPSYYRYQNKFTHAFSGSYDNAYASRYYSYFWADVVASEAWTRFEKAGIFDKEAAEDFKRTILEKGFAKPPLELLNEFLERPEDQPFTNEAYLRQRGLIALPSPLAKSSIFVKREPVALELEAKPEVSRLCS